MDRPKSYDEVYGADDGTVAGTSKVAVRLQAPSSNGDATEKAPEVVVQLDTVQPERVDWLWRGRLPLRKLAVLDGDPGTGKSTLAVDIAARVTKGSRMPDGSKFEGPANVVLIPRKMDSATRCYLVSTQRAANRRVSTSFRRSVKRTERNGRRAYLTTCRG